MKQETVKPVVRALLVLEAMNRRSISSIAQLHRQTGLPKPTLVRLLDTLINAGYVHRLDRRRGYRLKSRVLALSQGFEFHDEIIVTAIPRLRAFTQKHKWPVSLATFDTDAMVPKYSTIRDSPLSYEPDMASSRTSVTGSALGHAWLAFRPADERGHVVNTLARSRRQSERLAQDPARLTAVLSRVRRKGFATTPDHAGDQAMGIAVPVLKDGRASAAITMRYYRSAMPLARALERYLPDLLVLAASIADVQAE